MANFWHTMAKLSTDRAGTGTGNQPVLSNAPGDILSIRRSREGETGIRFGLCSIVLAFRFDWK
ncbi:MAG: hypothetical protein R3C17_05155 [Planctomycetaceae bacterium]